MAVHHHAYTVLDVGRQDANHVWAIDHIRSKSGGVHAGDLIEEGTEEGTNISARVKESAEKRVRGYTAVIWLDEECSLRISP